MRRHPLYAPVTLVLLVAGAALVGIVASKALPSSSTPTQVRAGVHHHFAVPAHGYPGSATGTVKTADVNPTA